MKTVNITLAHHQYPIYIGEGLLSDHTLLSTHIKDKQILLVSNQTVADHYAALLEKSLTPFNWTLCLLPDGEQHKTLNTANILFDALLSHQHRRNTTLIALGGGVMGDITGFAAHCYQRGVPFIQIPTTLLAQVDASIGGKTGVNHLHGKNMIGAFHQPECVIIDINTLNTLPDREFFSGLAEVIKHAFILDETFVTWLENHIDNILARDPSSLIDMIDRSCHIKANIVMQDETEKMGIRQLLNFGHTFAHAIETATEYKQYLHGEAVAIGMVMAAKLSSQLDLLPKEDVTRLETLLSAAELPIALSHPLEPARLVELMQHDKKNTTDALSLVLLQTVGNAVFKNSVSQKVVLQSIEK